MNRLVVLSVVFSLVTGPVGAAGQNSSESLVKSGSFNDVDRNQDGVISRQEAASISALEVVFDSADSNNDGALDLEEFSNSGSSLNPGVK